MTTVVGGLRARLLHDSLTAVLETGLAGLGWLDPGRQHLPFEFLHGPHHWEIPVTFNSIVITTQGTDTEEIEVGSNLTRHTTITTIDLYAESDALGTEVANDMRDLLRGRLAGGADRFTFPILDFTLATPTPLGYATVVTATAQRSVVQVPEEWARHVFTVSVVVEDTYY